MHLPRTRRWSKNAGLINKSNRRSVAYAYVHRSVNVWSLPHVFRCLFYVPVSTLLQHPAEMSLSNGFTCPSEDNRRCPALSPSSFSAQPLACRHATQGANALPNIDSVRTRTGANAIWTYTNNVRFSWCPLLTFCCHEHIIRLQPIH